MAVISTAHSRSSPSVARHTSSARLHSNRAQASPERLRSLTERSADVLVIDSSNILAQATASRERWRHVEGHTLRRAFADWLTFLQLWARPSLTVAVFDAPKVTRQAQRREALSANYLRRRTHRQQQHEQRQRHQQGAQAQSEGKPQHSKDPLWPFKKAVSQAGGVPIVAHGGWEGDDCAAAVCSVVRSTWPAASLALASGDSDLAQLLDERTAWLQMQQLPSLTAPQGVAWVSAAGFERERGFSPAALPDWLALTGKKQANIGGLGVGAGPAGKLLQRFGSLDAAAAAAARGELKGWSPQIQRLLLGSDLAAAEALHRNRRLFTLEMDAGVLADQDRRRLEQAIRSAMVRGSSSRGEVASAHSGASSQSAEHTQLAWAHPFQAARWRYIEMYAKALSTQLTACGQAHKVKAVVRGGFAADLVVDSVHPAEEVVAASSSKVIVVIIGPGDLPPAAVERARAGCMAAEGKHVLHQAAMAQRNKALLPVLSGALQHHIQLLRKSGGCNTVCMPWWHILDQQLH